VWIYEGFLFILNLFIMIYKFECNEIKDSAMEVELRDDLSSGYVSFTFDNSEELPMSIFLSKKDVYHLVGALHLIQKEMKEL